MAYYGQLDPNWRKNLQEVLDEQEEVIINEENKARAKFLPKRVVFFGVGIVLVLSGLIIYKYK